MVTSAQQYPKLLAFLEAFYPALYKKLKQHTDKSDLVEANLICSNNPNSYQAIIFSKGEMNGGELLDVCIRKNSPVPYCWDWRWVFAVKILFADRLIFPLKFQQKVIALPTGRYPLTETFFNTIRDEFEAVLDEVMNQSIDAKIPMRESYYNYLISVNL